MADFVMKEFKYAPDFRALPPAYWNSFFERYFNIPKQVSEGHLGADRPNWAGWLEKRGPTLSYRWLRRYVVMKTDSITYYEDAEQKVIKGAIPVKPQSRIVAFRDSSSIGDAIKHRNRPCGFVFDSDPWEGRNRRLYYFDATTSEMLASVTDAFDRVSGLLKNTLSRQVTVGIEQDNSKAPVTADVLSKQNSETSQAILTCYALNPMFQSISARLTQEIMQRDKEDGEKLGKGIQKAVDKGVLPSKVDVESTMKVSVSGKSADEVADEIIAALGDAPSKGCILILQGLSGTGKGTTVAKLKEKLPNAQTWSNGNVFRSLTLLAVTWSEKEGLTIDDALAPEKLKEFCEMLEFNKFGSSTTFDVKIEGLGMKHFVSEVEKTVLKDSKVAKNIPTVAEVTQGECILFVSDALSKMSAAGINVLVEGREQTLNHIRSPHRFELVLDDNSIIGKRQAALQVGGKAWAEVKSTTAGQEAVDSAIKNALADLCKVTADILAKQNSETSQAILAAYGDDLNFQKIAQRLTKEIMQRDKEDGDKLGSGIQKAVDKGVLPSKVNVEPTTRVSVSGKSADQVAGEIITALGDAPSKGCVLILQGLSGTGKGTTVAKLKENLPNAQTWSNGNIFRSITLLAVTWAEQEGKTLEDALAPDKLKDFCAMLEFNKFGDSTAFDVKIEGLGMEYLVSEVEKTVLKDSKVAKNIPTVAEVTQGECILFVSDALTKMSAAGINVLVEGREQTLNHIRSPHRFELVLDDNSIIGKRQAALQVGGKAWEEIGKSSNADHGAVHAAIQKAISSMS